VLEINQVRVFAIMYQYLLLYLPGRANTDTAQVLYLLYLLYLLGLGITGANTVTSEVRPARRLSCGPVA
jgi:hypothetical protein